MRITSKGQVTILLAVREATGLLPNCEVEFEVKGKKVLLRKSTNGRGSQKVPGHPLLVVQRLVC